MADIRSSESFPCICKADYILRIDIRRTYLGSMRIVIDDVQSIDTVTRGNQF